LKRILPLLLALVALAGVLPARAASPDIGGQASKLQTLYREIGVQRAGPAPHANEDVERAGRRALRQRGNTRLYALWRVLYAYKSNHVDEAFKDWIATVRATARADGDAELATLAEMMEAAYELETRGPSGVDDARWARFLEGSGREIGLMAGVERIRLLARSGRWTQASQFAGELFEDLEERGSIARPLLAEAHQVHSYTLSEIGDKDGALDHMAEAARLDERDAFYMRKIERLYDIAYTAAELGEIQAAEQFADMHHRMSEATGDQDLLTWDQNLCALIADARDDPRAVLRCLADAGPALAAPRDRVSVSMLRLRAKALARTGYAARARSDLTVLDQAPPRAARPDPVGRMLVEAYIANAEGRGKDAFALFDRWRATHAREASATQAATAAQISSALEAELQAKRSESRRLTAEVELTRRLVQATGVIAALMALLVVGGVAWALYMRRTQAHLKDARGRAEAASDAKSSFLAVMSHELRTPLNGMLGMAQALRADELGPGQREQVDLLIDSGETLLVLLNDILDLSKIEAGKLEIAPTAGDLVQAVGRLVNGFQPTAREKGIDLSFGIDGDPPPCLMFDVVRVRQCVANLVSNALKFTSEGRVEVTLACAPEPGSGRQSVKLTVSDTGIGMSAATLDKLFGAFTQADASTTRNYGGSGLGLNITRRLAELMGGSVNVRSREGQGSLFTLRFMADATEAQADSVIPATAPAAVLELDALASLGGRRVLVVDDHPINRRVIRLFLEPFGCELVEVENGQEALAAVEAEAFDIVLMDVNMPVMDGLEATRRLRADPRWRNLPIVALTADVMSTQIRTCLEAGMDAHVAKPIDMRNLLTILAQVVVAAQARTATRARKMQTARA
jgi:two-component system, sensor histidine kinase